MTRAFFPLRSSVDFFHDPESPEPVAKAKQAAVLFDEVYFEDGLINASLTKQGSWTMQMHPDDITDEDRKLARTIPEPGTGFEIRIGPQPAANVLAPPEAMHPIISGQFTARYMAEWRTDVLDELSKIKPDWVRYAWLPDDHLKQTGLLDAAQQIQGELHTDAVAPDDHIRQSFIVKSFSRDLAVAGSIGATMQVTSLFEPLLKSDPHTITIN
jgi:hypothetical protein